MMRQIKKRVKTQKRINDAADQNWLSGRRFLTNARSDEQIEKEMARERKSKEAHSKLLEIGMKLNEERDEVTAGKPSHIPIESKVKINDLFESLEANFVEREKLLFSADHVIATAQYDDYGDENALHDVDDEPFMSAYAFTKSNLQELHRIFARVIELALTALKREPESGSDSSISDFQPPRRERSKIDNLDELIKEIEFCSLAYQELTSAIEKGLNKVRKESGRFLITMANQRNKNFALRKRIENIETFAKEQKLKYEELELENEILLSQLNAMDKTNRIIADNFAEISVQFDENVAEKKELELLLERAKHELEAERQEANELRKKLTKKKKKRLTIENTLQSAEIERLRLRLKTLEQELKEKQKSPTPRPKDEFPAQSSKNDFIALPQVPTIWVRENEGKIEYKEEESTPKTQYLRPQYYSNEERSLSRRSSISEMSVWERLSQRRPRETNRFQTPRIPRPSPGRPVEKKIFKTTLDLGLEKTKSLEFPSLSIQPMNKTTRMSRTAGGPSPRRYYAKQRFY